MRLLVARCEVVYTGRLTAVLPEAVRLVVLKSDGSVLVHDDAGGFKPLNWMTPPTVIETEGDPLTSLVVRKRAGKTEDKLEIRVLEVISDIEHEFGEAAAAREGRGREPISRPSLRTGPARSSRGCGSSGANGRRTSARSISCAATPTTGSSRSR